MRADSEAYTCRFPFFLPPIVFAPTEAAFAELDAEVVDYLTSDAGKDDLVQTLKYHVLPVVLPAVNVDPGPVHPLLGIGIPIIVTVLGGNVYLNGDSQVEQTDLLANNGIVHLISKVLEIPPSAAPTDPPTDAPTFSPTKGSMAPHVSVGLMGTIMAMVLAMAV